MRVNLITVRGQIVPHAFLSKETLGLAAEFAVASELCRRGIYAQLTLGNRKCTDLLVDIEDGKMLRVQVKAKQKRQWPALKGVSGAASILVLVDYEKKKITERPDFFILTASDWQKLIRKTLIKPGKVKEGLVSLDKNYVPHWGNSYVGMGLAKNEVAEFKECWESFSVLLGLAP